MRHHSCCIAVMWYNMQRVQHVTHSVKIDHLVRFNILKHVLMQNRGNMNESIPKKEKIQNGRD